MAITPGAPTPTTQNSQANTQARPDQGKMISPAVAAANTGLADSLEASAKARIQYNP